MTIITRASSFKERFELRASELRSTDKYSRRMLRSDVRKIFESKDAIRVPFWVYDGPVLWVTGVLATAHASKTRIYIGCTRFNGENFKKLKRWALAGRKS